MSELAENAHIEGAERKNQRKRRLIIFGAVSLLNLGLLALLLIALLTPASPSGSDPLVGHTAPNFSLAMLRPQSGQKTLSLSNYQGKSVVLLFWASWCDPCKEEAPMLEKTWRQVQAQGENVVFLGIDFQESQKSGASFLHLYGITYPAALDANGSVASKYYVTSLPATIFINQHGVVVSRKTGELTDQILASNLQLIT
jgi:cytochrome c biogenesis protein CcmG/thiol:disulfide interchange protein DsbE